MALGRKKAGCEKKLVAGKEEPEKKPRLGEHDGEDAYETECRDEKGGIKIV